MVQIHTWEVKERHLIPQVFSIDCFVFINNFFFPKANYHLWMSSFKIIELNCMGIQVVFKGLTELITKNKSQ